MRRIANMLAATAIVAAEVASLCLAIPSASAQEATTVRRQQRLLHQQQRQIEENQRRLEAQQQQLAQPNVPAYGSPAPRNLDRGLLGNIGNCPVGWTYSLFNGCLPTVVVVH